MKPEVIIGRLDDILERFNINKGELSSSPSYECDYYDVAAFVHGNELTIGYIADDHHPTNPMDYDGCGHLVRQEENQGLYYEHLGRDGYGDLNDSLPHEDALKGAWIEEAVRTIEFNEFARNWVWHDQVQILNQDDLEEVAAELFERHILGGISVTDFSAFEKALRQCWAEEVSKDQDTKFTCPVSVFSSGALGIESPDEIEDPDCNPDKWDAVWVPCNDLLEEIVERSQIYRFGQIFEESVSGCKAWHVKIKSAAGGDKSPNFEKWIDAFTWLKSFVESNNLEEKFAQSDALPLRAGEVDAALEVAQASLREYEAYLQGNAFIEVFDTLTLQGEGEDACWELDGEDACCGYYEADCLSKVIIASIKNIAERHAQQNADAA